MINRCIAILEAPKENPKFNRLEALRFLVHLVGDIHQPLHVGTGFFDLAGTKVTLIEDPTKVKGQQSDIGGNDLTFNGGELHAFWDTCLIQRLTGNQLCVGEEQMEKQGEYKKLVVEIDKVADDKGWLTPGDYHGWAEQWATASVHEAEKAYEPITFGAAMLKKPTDKRFVSIGITPPATYADDELVRARTQIAKGGVHLAQLLNSINWR
jgi:hypothetical protein